jgi:MFS transporter, DHA1 family, multidrug resistance protein
VSALRRWFEGASGSWQFVLVVFVASHGLEVAAWGHVTAFSPLFIERELGVAPGEVPRWTGILAAAPLIVAAPISPFWGVLADRFGRKPVILRCFLFSALAYAAAAVAQDVWQFLLIRLFQGLTFGTNAVVIAALTDIVPNRRMGLAIGLTQMVFPVGNSIGPLFGSGLIALIGLRGMFWIDAIMSAVAFLMVLVLYAEPARPRQTERTMLQQLADVSRTVWNLPAIRLTFGLVAIASIGWTLVMPFLPVLIARVYAGGDPAVAIGIILAVFGTVAGIAAPLAGRLTDQFGPPRVVAFNMLGLALMSGGLALATTPVQVVLVMLLGAVPFGASNTALYAHLARYTPRQHMSAVMSLTPVARNGAMLLGPLIGAAVADLGVGAIFFAAFVVYGVAFAVSLAVARVSAEAAPTPLRPDSAAG